LVVLRTPRTHTVIASLTTQRNAIKMLHDRVSVIVQYLNAVAAGTAPKDQETFRQISALISSLPATDSLDFREEFMTVSSWRSCRKELGN
jgi:COP9 signalosome complex subunit 6